MPNHVHDDRNLSVRLEQAILIYSRSSGLNRDGTHYATVHPVSIHESASPIIEAGRPLDKGTLEKLLRSLMKTAGTQTGVFSERILSVGTGFVVWWQPPGERAFFFDCAASSSIGKRSGSGRVPGLVFVASGCTLRVFAVKGRTRPGTDTLLHHAPLMNVYADGKVCTGSAPLPGSTLSSSIAAWEAAFWNSSFTHPNQQRAVRYKGGLEQFSLDLLNGKFTRFPEHVLCPHPVGTVGKLVEWLETA
jgi:PRTRC genetic system protein B